ncbi:MAG: hypothetical protein SAJ72_20670 [Jaaginema sp. PMC 1080.18]|nr:hypothetical protein [Jaaginema sp. PMC 1080.18]
MADYTIISSKPTQCKSCDNDIIWAKTKKGKFIPLDLNPLEPHFITCPQSKNWKGKGKVNS